MLGQSLYQNLNFSFLGQVFQYYLLGLKACQLRFASFGIKAQVLKLGLLSLYLWFPVIILSCSFYVLYSLLLFCDVHLVKIVHQAPKKKKKKKRLQKRNRKQKKKKNNIVRSFNSLKSKYYFLLSSSFDLVFLSYFLAIGISLNTTS